ncbi:MULTISPECIES: oligosaccharide flippase family protein [Cyanophyceae]|uniref:oligosaccharide flippase family protein n=1 Tax=Cyanophyceae TaxID=3028117 RepID=UPI0016856DB5|nr:oligosaccharide flippase family protein [Trichocoleus sp. FACHB-69]MBD1933252.1 oligosaccharide flippase family protein [Trichocoleus sp. FACHB-69]
MSLKTQVMRGGIYLVLRQGLGVFISLAGVMLVTKVIGPENYGLYAAAVSIFLYLQMLSQLGIEVYLVRREGEEELGVYHQAFTLLLLQALAGMLLAFLALPLIESWVNIKGFRPVAQVLFLGLPVVLLNQVPMARLERNLDYKRVALIELLGQLFYYVIAFPLAFRGAGVWALVAGWWLQQAQTLALLYWSAGYRPRFAWNWDLVKQMWGYGMSFSASIWVWQLRTLINPLLVGRFAGAEAVGYVALAIRIIEILGFVKAATWRISIATLSRLQGDKERLVRAVTEGMGLQILAVGPLLVGVSWVSPWLIPLVFGDRWLPVVQVYPFIALGYLTNSLFNMHSSALYVLRRNWEVTAFHIVHMALFAGAAFLLLPRLGLIGYGWAEIVALTSYVVIHFYLVRDIGNPDYRLTGLWWGAFAAALFAYQLGWWAALGLVVVALLPSTHRKLRDYIKSIRGAKSEGAS